MPERPVVLLMLLIALSGCASASYVAGLQPGERVFQKAVVGGVVSFAGAELAAPGFTLYADGTVLYYDQLEDGRRVLVSAKLSRNEFQALYDRIQRIMAMDFEPPASQPLLPETIFSYANTEKRISGLGFTAKGGPFDSLQSLSADIDGQHWPLFRPFTAPSVQLYVKAVGAGDGSVWPAWGIDELALEKIFRKDVSFYEPNVEENSVIVTGPLAIRVQAFIREPGVYKKFAYLGGIWAAGYRPILP